jgi:Holliday junction DNA helicase RuvA
MSLGEFEVLDLNESSLKDGSSTVNRTSELSSSGVQAEALSALINLGYSHGDAAQAVAKAVEKSELLETPAIIKLALKLLAITH